MTADPFSHLRSLADASLSSLDDLGAELEQPFDDVPDFDPEQNPEIDVDRHLNGDRAYVRAPTRRLYVDYRPQMDAYKHLDHLPAEGESLHGVISGKYALWDLCPALIEKTGAVIEDLYLCTLGFSKQNGAEMCGLLDDGRVRRMALICSYYFEKTSAGIYNAVVPELLKRGQRVLAMRSHCKLIVVRTAGHGDFVVESSANLRSCKNLEQFVMTRDTGLFNFHAGWLEELLTRGAK